MEDNNTEPTLDLTTRSSPAPEAMLIGGSTNSMDRGTLRVFDGDGSYKDYRINSGENKIGRKESDCDVFIASHGLSRVHCCILIDNGEHFIMDYNSSNQTHRHSHRLRPSVFYELTDGCELLLANIRCVYYHGDITGTSAEREDEENVEDYEAETDTSTPASPANSSKVCLVPSSLPAPAVSEIGVGKNTKEEKADAVVDGSGSSTCSEASPGPSAQGQGVVNPAPLYHEEPSPPPLSAGAGDPTLPYSPGTCKSSPPLLGDHCLMEPTVPYELDETELEDKTTTTKTTTEGMVQAITDGDNKGSQPVDKKEQQSMPTQVSTGKTESALETCLFDGEEEKVPVSHNKSTPAEGGSVQEEHMDMGDPSENLTNQVTVAGKKRGDGGRRRGRPPGRRGGGGGGGGKGRGQKATKDTATPSSPSTVHLMSDESPDLSTEVQQDAKALVPPSTPPSAVPPSPPPSTSSSCLVSQQSALTPDDSKPVRRTPTRRAARGAKRSRKTDEVETQAGAIKNSPRSRRTSLPSDHANHSPYETPKVMFTGLIDEHGAKAVEEMGGSLVHSVADCTHLVTDKVRRTIKFLCCLARGCLVVQTKWLDECRAQGEFVSADGFLLRDRVAERQHNFTLSKSITKARASPLLSGWKVHLTKGIKPSPTEMGEIIISAGGEVLSEMPSALADKVFVVSTMDDLSQCQPALSAGIPVCSTEVILGGILRQELDITTHQLHEETDNKKRKAAMPAGSAAKRRKR